MASYKAQKFGLYFLSLSRAHLASVEFIENNAAVDDKNMSPEAAEDKDKDSPTQRSAFNLTILSEHS